MKLWKLVLLLLLTNTSSAFFVNTGANHGVPLQIQQKQVSIEIEGDNARVEITTELYNPAETEIVFQVLEPLAIETEIVDFFVGMEGRGYSILEGRERLEYLFAQAQENEFSQFFAFGSPKYPKLFRSENLSIGGRQKVRTKNVFNLPVKKQDDFSFVEMFFSDRDSFPNTEISFTLDGTVEHFYHSLSGDYLLDTNDGVSLLWTGEPSDHLQFLWSEVPSAEIGTSFLGMEYRARFVPPSKKDIQEVTILVDRSGSLTGLPWQRTKDWVEFLLQTFGEDTRVRIGFFSDDIAWHEEEFQLNSYEFQKDFFGFLSGIAPVGKTDITKALLGVQNGWTAESENRVVFLITDETTLEDEFWKKQIVKCEQGSMLPCLNESYIVLQFSENLENDLALFAKISGGFPLKLFRSSPNLVEKDEFLEKLHSLNTSPIGVEDKNIVQDEDWEMQEILPKFFPSRMRSDSFFFVGRHNESSQEKNGLAGHFVSREWGVRKIAEILESFISPPLSISPPEGGRRDQLDALLAIGRTFGISTKFFNNETTRSELEKNLSAVSSVELLREILRLDSNFSPEKGIKFLNGIPFYEISLNPSLKKREALGWRQFNFPDLVRAETHILIAPFSEAQKQLFLQFPEFVAAGFGVGNEVHFCTELRCISVLGGEREESKPSDRAFFKEYDTNHWAHSYIVRAVEEGLLEPELNGKLHPNRAIDRGEFAQMVVKAFPDRVRTLRVRTREVGFTDVDIEAVQILAERGVVKGYPDGTFRPLQSLTRAEGVKILLSLSSNSKSSNSESTFTDVTGWEKPWVNEAVRRGMVKGYGDGTFRPHNKLTRAEALKLVFEMSK